MSPYVELRGSVRAEVFLSLPVAVPALPGLSWALHLAHVVELVRQLVQGVRKLIDPLAGFLRSFQTVLRVANLRSQFKIDFLGRQ